LPEGPIFVGPPTEGAPLAPGTTAPDEFEPKERMMRRLSRVLLTGALLVTVAAPAFGQQANASWQHMWYWGGQGGVFLYKDAAGTQTAADFGGHWLITGTHSALFLGIDRLAFSGTPAVQISAADPASIATFSAGQRLQAMLLAMPATGAVQVYGGIGVAIEQITDAQPATGSTATQSEIDAVASKAYPIFSGGFQMQIGSRWALFGTYQYMPSADGFLITSEQHAITGGLRFALTGSHEDVLGRQ